MAAPEQLTAVSVSTSVSSMGDHDPLNLASFEVSSSSLSSSSNAQCTPNSSSVERRAAEFAKAARCGLVGDEHSSTDSDSNLNAMIDLVKVRELAFGGVPDSALLRGVYWRLLLGFLPADRSLWAAEVKSARDLYREFVDDLTLYLDPARAQQREKRSSTGDSVDHPLSQGTGGTWERFFKDTEIIEEVDKDVRRTLPHLHFFNSDPSTGSTEHYEALKRILFVYAKLNPGIRYVQGMNEILGPLYYVVVAPGERQLRQQQLESADGETAAPPPGVDAETAALLFPPSKSGEIGGCEADAFFCFTSLMGEIRDNFIKTLDRSESGVQGSIRRFERLLRVWDVEVWTHLERQSINPQFYSFRWITLLLSQEFDLPDMLRLWDSCFADPERFDFFYLVCVAMLICVRDDILDGDFSSNLKILQNYPVGDVNEIIRCASMLQSGTYRPPEPREGWEPLEDADQREFAVAGNSKSGDRKAAALHSSKPPVPETNYSTWGSTIASLFGGSRERRSQLPVTTRSAPSSTPVQRAAAGRTALADSFGSSGIGRSSENRTGSSSPSSSSLKPRPKPSSNLFADNTEKNLMFESKPRATIDSVIPAPGPVISIPSSKTTQPPAATSQASSADVVRKDDGGSDPLAGVNYTVHPLE